MLSCGLYCLVSENKQKVSCQRIVLHKFSQSGPQIYKMAERDTCRELLEAQQQTIASFVESIEKDISANSELAQSLLEQASGAGSRSMQEQVEGLIAKDKQNASMF